jgi:nucleotide-binding universal stress UspA family protein
MADIPRAILVPIDFGEPSAHAVAIAGALAQRCGASLLLLHAGVPAAAVGTDHLRRFGQKHTTAAFTSLLDDRAPIDAILRHSERCDLTVMGTHGRHGLSRLWLGSVAEGILRRTSRPLLIVRAASGGSRPDVSFRRVLVSASSRLTGVDTIDYARMIAAVFNGQTFDVRHRPIEAALEQTGATLLAVATPRVRDSTWLSNVGQPIVRFCDRPILFVPEQALDYASAHVQLDAVPQP